MKKMFLLVVVCACALGLTCQAHASGPIGNIGEGLDDIIQGLIGSPGAGDGSDSGHGKGAARFVGGVWKVATFWYPEEGGPDRAEPASQ